MQQIELLASLCLRKNHTAEYVAITWIGNEVLQLGELLELAGASARVSEAAGDKAIKYVMDSRAGTREIRVLVHVIAKRLVKSFEAIQVNHLDERFFSRFVRGGLVH